MQRRSSDTSNMCIAAGFINAINVRKLAEHEELEKHKRRHDSDYFFECTICHVRYKSRMTLIRYNHVHNDNESANSPARQKLSPKSWKQLDRQEFCVECSIVIDHQRRHVKLRCNIIWKIIYVELYLKNIYIRHITHFNIEIDEQYFANNIVHLLSIQEYDLLIW